MGETDLISRQAAIDGVKTLHDVAWKNRHEPTLSANVVLDMIRELPSAQPKKKGKWETEIRSNRDGTRSAYYACSVCGVYAIDEYKFCPNCGARMEELDETD